jgi:probable phosphoglycerate mutase
MIKVILIHPGATEYDQQHRIQGRLGIPMSDEGREEVRQSIVSLASVGMEVIYAAPGMAATETAEMIGDALDLRVKVLEKLQNLNLGLWQGMLVDDVRTKQPKVYRQWQDHPDNICPPEGEMLDVARQRVEKALDKLARKHKSETIGLVVPEPLGSLVRAYFANGNEDVGDLWKPIATGTWETIAPSSAAEIS